MPFRALCRGRDIDRAFHVDIKLPKKFLDGRIDTGRHVDNRVERFGRLDNELRRIDHGLADEHGNVGDVAGLDLGFGERLQDDTARPLRSVGRGFVTENDPLLRRGIEREKRPSAAPCVGGAGGVAP